MLDKLTAKIKEKKESLLIMTLLVISGMAHGYNMFNFPYFENDEGVYLSQAWSLLTQGKLAPYTYWYDHAPVGWMFTAIWLQLTGGLFTFGFSMNSGRVFMLVIHLFSTYLVIKIAKKLTGDNYAGVISAIIFALSPLGIYFQRRLLLDNIMIFFVLWSYCLIIGNRRKLSHYIASAVLFALAVLTKENAIFFIPSFLYTIYSSAHTHHKKFVLIKWILVSGFIISLYFLYALLNGEFFPYGSVLGGSSPHVSLMETLKYQFTRSGGGISNIENSYFWRFFNVWFKQDSFIIFFGIVSNIFLLLISIVQKRKTYLGFSLLGLFFWLFLLRGGVVFEFYISPLIPLLSLYIGVVLFEIILLLKKFTPKFVSNAIITATCLSLFTFYLNYSQESRALGQNQIGNLTYASKQTLAQIESINWVKNNLPRDSIIIIDNYSYLELHNAKNSTDRVFPNAHWYWKVNSDNDIKEEIIRNNPESIEYILLTPQMDHDLILGASLLVTEAHKNSGIIKEFASEGWGVIIKATRYPMHILERSWKSYKERFITEDGNTSDPADKLTTSEGQSYTLLRAVWMNDKETFDSTWNWTKNKLMNEHGTFAWKWQKDARGVERILDYGTASDADTDIALALLMAHKRWGGVQYLSDARVVLKGVWDTEVKEFDGRRYLVAGNWAKDKEQVVVNPSYLSPYAYRIFAEADKSHPWIDLVDSSYELLEGCMKSSLVSGQESVNLPPDWCAMNKDLSFTQVQEDGLDSINYSYDAIRTMWRLALDYKWFGEPRAKELLELSGEFLENKWNSEGRLLVGYTHDGQPWENYDSVLSYAANLANFIVTNPGLADTIYEDKVLGKFYEDFDSRNHFWDDPNNYYSQNWGWFATALYAGLLPNFWN